MLFLDVYDTGMYFAFDLIVRVKLQKVVPQCVDKQMRSRISEKKDRLNAHSALSPEDLN